MRVSWLHTKIFIAEHTHFSADQIDRMEVVEFMLLLKEAEKIYDAKKKAWEKK